MAGGSGGSRGHRASPVARVLPLEYLRERSGRERRRSEPAADALDDRLLWPSENSASHGRQASPTAVKHHQRPPSITDSRQASPTAAKHHRHLSRLTNSRQVSARFTKCHGRSPSVTDIRQLSIAFVKCHIHSPSVIDICQLSSIFATCHCIAKVASVLPPVGALTASRCHSRGGVRVVGATAAASMSTIVTEYLIIDDVFEHP